MSMDKYKTDPKTVFVQGVTVADYDALRSRAEAAEQAAAQIAVERACLEIDNHKLKAEVARLTEIITKTNTHISYRLDIERRTATEAALRYAATDIQRNGYPRLPGDWDKWIESGIAALLGGK